MVKKSWFYAVIMVLLLISLTGCGGGSSSGDDKKSDILVDSVKINEGDKTLKQNDTATFTVTILPDNATDKSITWKSSNSEVVTITAADNTKCDIKANVAGEASITATTTSGKIATVKVIIPSIIIEKYQLTIVNTSGGTISITPKKAEYEKGEKVKIMAIADDGYVFNSWNGTNGNEIDKDGMITMNGNKEVIAIFEKLKYTLKQTVEPMEAGIITADPQKDYYSKGEKVNLTISLKKDYDLKEIGGANGSEVIPSGTYSGIIVMDGNKEVKAICEKMVETFKLNITTMPENSGTVKIEPEKSVYTKGDIVKITAVPNAQYAFRGWKGKNGSEVTTTESIFVGTIVMNGEKEIAAQFDFGVVDITVNEYNKKALLVLNISALTGDKGISESVGKIPLTIPTPAPSYKKGTQDKSYIKDLQSHVDFKKIMKRDTVKRGKITDKDINYTFKVASGQDVKEVKATKVYGTDDASCRCLIYLQDGIEPKTDWNKVGSYFDNEIYSKMTQSYGEVTDVDANGKVVILYYDMGDTEVRTMGYFMSSDLDPGVLNDMEIFYMNVKWGVSLEDRNKDPNAVTDPLDPEMIRTLSHEFQHMINYGYRIITKKLPEMDTWMNEGLAEAAEQLISKKPGESRITTIIEDKDNKIKNGKPLCIWGNDDESYALSYTFMEYLKNQSKEKEKVYKDIINNQKGDYQAVEDLMKEENPGFYTDFSKVLLGYRMANMINGDNEYGYKDEKNIFNFSDSVKAPDTFFSNKLQPGGAIYLFPSQDELNSFVPEGQELNIKFIRINK